MAETRPPTTTITPATPFSSRPTVPPHNPLDGDANLKAAYEKLAAQSAEADKTGNAAEVGRIKPLKIKAFQEWKASQTAAERAEKERLRKIRV